MIIHCQGKRMFKKILFAACVLNLIQVGSVFALGQDREDGLPGMPYRIPTDKEFRVVPTLKAFLIQIKKVKVLKIKLQKF
jgi:hypothetical protein